MASHNKKIFVGLGRKWDSDKFPYSNNSHGGEGARGNKGHSWGIDTMEGVNCSNMTITPDLKSVVFQKGNMEMNVEIVNITSLDPFGNILTINTEDQVPYFVGFTSISELQSAENRLYTVLNGGADPGCGFGQGDFNDSDFGVDFG